MRVLRCLLTIAVSGIALSAQPMDLDDKSMSMSYGGYLFQKVFNRSAERWSFHVSKAGRLIRTFEDPAAGSLHLGEAEGKWLSMGVIPAVAGDDSQVLLHTWTGGNRCCNIYWLVQIAPVFRVILDTTVYHFDGLASIRDLDGDGNWEFAFSTTTFSYFVGAPAFSPTPLAWFKYDGKLGKYVAANDLCFTETRDQVQKDEVRLRARPWKENPDPDELELRQAVLEIVLAFLYAGHDQEAWAFFDREYPNRRKSKDKIDVAGKAQSDPFFQAVRRRMHVATQ